MRHHRGYGGSYSGVMQWMKQQARRMVGSPKGILLLLGVGIILVAIGWIGISWWMSEEEEGDVGVLMAPKGPASKEDYFFYCRHNIHPQEGEGSKSKQMKIIHVINLRRIVFLNGNWFLEREWMQGEMFKALGPEYKVVFIDLPNQDKVFDKEGREEATLGGGEAVFCNNSIIINFSLDKKIESDDHLISYLDKAKSLGVNVLGIPLSSFLFPLPLPSFLFPLSLFSIFYFLLPYFAVLLM